MTFLAEYQALEERFRRQAEDEGGVYVPNIAPTKPVEWVLVCMEPSLMRWNRSIDDPKAGLEPGARNFVSSPEDFILHYCAHRYLSGSYHVTDLAKGAMTVKQAGVARKERYNRWYPLLLDEVRLVGLPNVRVVAVGDVVADFLNDNGLPYPLERVIHYSGMAARGRNVLVSGREAEFQRYAETVSADDFRATAAEVLDLAGVPQVLRASALARLRDGKLTESRLKLMFIYKQAFETFMRRRPVAVTGPLP